MFIRLSFTIRICISVSCLICEDIFLLSARVLPLNSGCSSCRWDDLPLYYPSWPRLGYVITFLLCSRHHVKLRWLQVQWPSEPLASVVSATLSDLSMPRFCRRFPTLLNTVMGQVLDLISVRIQPLSHFAARSILLPHVGAPRTSMHYVPRIAFSSGV